MANEKNLVPMDQRSESEARALGHKGGVASGAARRRKRALKEAADLYLALPVSDRRSWNRLSRKGIDPEDIDNQMAVIVGLTDQAARGDARCAQVLARLLGEDRPPEDGSAGALAKAEALLEDLNGVIE